MIHSISREEMLERGCLLAEDLKDAFSRYEAVVVSAGGPEKMWQFLKRIYEQSPECAYADFYYPVLEGEQKKRFAEGLSVEERRLLAEFETGKSQVYFQAGREEVLKFLYGITARNWLFSTFYFTDRKVMIWGNYDLSFPVFCESREDLDYYIELGKQCGLECQI